MSEYQTVCRVDEISEGDASVFVVNDLPVGIFRVGDEFFAIDDRCPHAGASLARGFVEGDIIRCRIHHWGFCLRTGKYVDQDQPEFNARTIPLRVVGNEIQIRVSDE